LILNGAKVRSSEHYEGWVAAGYDLLRVFACNIVTGLIGQAAMTQHESCHFSLGNELEVVFEVCRLALQVDNIAHNRSLRAVFSLIPQRSPQGDQRIGEERAGERSARARPLADWRNRNPGCTATPHRNWRAYNAKT
jgi:hypothetical protein